MTYEIKQSSQAENDLANILEYIIFSLGNKKASDDFFNKLNKKILMLSESPLMYKTVKGEYIEFSDLRKMPVDNYLVIYHVDEKNKRIKLLRLFYQSQDYLGLI